ncbi:MAG TPA: AbrB/MazE/SpoVT family DNA-binding domain-containing protein [Chloroflexota bacterium]|nr:AbrB/MazE/SpoVT family DNA-binding domain-containing protein [Chloroflexota bacterium]
MRHYRTTLTERGQVTLPSEIRRKLGLKPRQKVHFEVDGDSIHIIPSDFTLESIRGMVPPLSEPKSIKEIFDLAAEEHARHVLDECASMVEPSLYC